MYFEKKPGVPAFEATEFSPRNTDFALLIPVINEGNRIITELKRANQSGVASKVDIIICDGGSVDNSLESQILKELNVNSLLVKKDSGKQAAQLRMGMWWALKRGYSGIITIDGNNKDSIEDVPHFIDKLKEGYGFVQGSRFVEGGKAENTPLIRWVSIKMLHVPIISLTAHYKFTDTTNNFRAYSAEYLMDKRVIPFRDIFMTYELLAYLSVRASQLGYSVCEIPVKRIYPNQGKTPTKISFIKGNYGLLRILILNAFGYYSPK